MNFNKWIDTLVEEKEIDTYEQFEIEKDGYLHIFDYGYIIDAIKATTSNEKKAIQNMLVRIDFANGDIKHYFRHLAKALV